MSYQSNGSDVQQYAAVQQSDFDAESGYGRRSGGAASIAAADSSTGATRKVVGVFVAAVVVACVFVAALANLYSTPAVTMTAGMATELAANDAKHVGAAKGKYSGKEPLIVEAHNTEVCDDPNYSSETLKLAHEMSVVALLAKPEAADPGPVFETSCILNIGDWFYAVSDDSPSIAKIRTRLAYNDPLNKLIPPSKPLVDGPQTELGFEALFWDEATGVFTAVIEAVPLDGEPNTFHSMLYDFKIRADESAYDVSGACPSNFEFTSGNKGFEGAALVRDSKGEQYVLGLCEGNFCEGGKRGRTAGNGRVVLLKREANLNIHGKVYPCGWAEQRVIELPHSIAFRDYSAITLYGSDPTRLRVAIASQENSAVWVGFLNADTWEFTEKDSRLFDFPRDGDCEVVYCNVEGLDFLNDDLLVAASDQMKNAGRQSSRCLAKDQSVHVFVIPPVPEVAEEEEKPAKEEKGKEKGGKGKGKKAEPEVAVVEGEELKAKEKAEKAEDSDAAEEQEKAEKAAEKKQKRAAEKQEKEEAEAAKKQKKEAEEAEEKQEKEEKSAKKKAEKAEEKEEKEKADEEKEEKAKAKEAKKEAAEEEEKAERKQKRAEKKQKEEAEEQEEAQAKAERKAKREAKRAAEKQEKEQKEEAEKQEKAEKEAEKKAAKASSKESSKKTKESKESKKKSAEADD